MPRLKITRVDRELVWKLWQGVCPYCHSDLERGEEVGTALRAGAVLLGRETSHWLTSSPLARTAHETF